MVTGISSTLGRQSGLIVFLLALFAAALIAGWWAGRAPQQTPAEDASPDPMARLLGRFSASIRLGEPWGIASAAALVVLTNLLASVLSFTLVSVLIVPVLLSLVVFAHGQGRQLRRLRASSRLSLGLFVVVGALEWATYVLASAAGANLGLSVLWPAHQGVATRLPALRLALLDAGSLYLVIFVVLAVQGVAEVLYLREVLRRGGALAPLRPW